MYPESIRESIFHKSNDADFWLVPLPLFEVLPRSMFPVNKRKKNRQKKSSKNSSKFIFHKSNDADFWLVPLPLFEVLLPRSKFPVQKKNGILLQKLF
jgi:hypothetical protein